MTSNEKSNAPVAAKEEIAAIELEFMKAWENGSNPTLQDYLAQYPQYASEITEFVLEFVALEGALGRTPIVTVPSDITRQATMAAMKSVFTSVENIKEARLALGWTSGQLAQELNLPSIMVLWIEGGIIVDSDTKLETKLGHLIGRTPLQTRMLLNAPAPPTIPAAHFMATGTPQNLRAQPRRFREALEECDQSGQLTDEQRREWLSQPDV